MSQHNYSPMRSVGRFIGHSLASVVGFVALSVIALIPVMVVKAFVALGVDSLAGWLHGLEVALLVMDIALFSVVFLTGAAVFLVEVLAEGRRAIIEAWNKDN